MHMCTDAATRESVSKMFLGVRRDQNKNNSAETFLGVEIYNDRLFQRDGKIKGGRPLQKHISGDIARSGFTLDLNNESREVYPS